MSEELSQEELLKRQKENCIFCKIVEGSADSKTVYEDERMRAVLDIRPAAKGHTLVLPNEHYPIMPLIPPDEFAHLFGRTASLSKAIKEGSLSTKCTLFVANGPVAGQQSPHFLFHIIPREAGDGLDRFTIPQKGVNQSDIEQLVKTNLYSVMREHLTKTNQAGLLQMGEVVSDEEAARIEGQATDPAPAQPPQIPGPTADQLATIIEGNPEIKALLLNEPEKLQNIVAEQPEFQQLFKGVDIMKLSARLKGEQAVPTPASPAQPTPSPVEAPATPPQPTPSVEQAAAQDEIVPATQMTMQQLFAFIDSKEKLRDYILKAPDKLKEIIPGHPRLSKFFEGSNVDAIIQAYQAHAEENDDAV